MELKHKLSLPAGTAPDDFAQKSRYDVVLSPRSEHCKVMSVLTEIVEDRNPWWREPDHRVARSFPAVRDLQPVVFRHLRRFEERRALVIMGPRQVGKTTILLQTADDLLDSGWPPVNLTYFDFSDDRITEEVTARAVVATEPPGLDPDHPRAFLFDEIGSAPDWDRWLKQAVDLEQGRFVVTDSAATVIRQKGRESGVGRWDERWLEGLTLREFSHLAGHGREAAETLRRRPEVIEAYLQLGGFPEFALGALRAGGVDQALILRRLREGVVEKAILRDIARAVRDPEPVRSLFVYLMQASGGIWNARKRAGDLERDERSVSQWESLLEDTLLVSPLPRHARHAAASLRSRPKLYASDHGLVQAFSLPGRPDTELRGRVLETAVFRHLREVEREHAHVSHALSYYRDRQGLEADFVLDLPAGRVVVEVTGSRRVKADKLARLRRVGELVDAERLALVYGGLASEDVDGVLVTAAARFLLDPWETIAP